MNLLKLLKKLETPHHKMMRTIDSCIYEYRVGSPIKANVKFYYNLLYVDIRNIGLYHSYFKRFV